MRKQRWFVSHPSGSRRQTPIFFAALEDFQAQHPKIELYLPPSEPIELAQRKIDLETADLIIAEVSLASTGSGIDLGLAYAAKKTVIAFHQGAGVISPIIPVVATAIHVYLTEEQIMNALKTLA